MREPPIACSLDAAGAGDQAARWAAVGRAADLVRLEPGRLTVQVGADSVGTLSDAVTVERGCCPHLSIKQAADRLTITGDEETLALIAAALRAGQHAAAR